VFRSVHCLAGMLALATLAGCSAPTTSTSVHSVPDTALSDVVQLSDQLGDAQRDYISECMTAAGFPQLAAAQALTTGAAPAAPRTPLAPDPLEAGPYTADQARAYGVQGTDAAFEEPQSGFVMSQDSGYDSALSSCHDQLDAAGGPQAARLVGDTTRLISDMNEDFVQVFTRRMNPSIADRLSCVRDNGYPSLPVDPGIAISDLLAAVQVPPGTETQNNASESEVPAGSVVVAPPPPPTRYTPSDAEIAFALVYVTCGQTQNFVAAWRRGQVAPRRQITTKYQSTLNKVGPLLKQAVAETQRYTSNGVPK